MNPLRIAAGVVSLLSEVVGREYRRVQFPYWPDGEAPLIDARLLGFRDGSLAPDVWATMPQQVSAESTAPEAGVDVAEKVPTPGRAHTPGVGHNVTAGLLISASIGLRDYADSDACEAPVYWRSIASQLDPK